MSKKKKDLEKLAELAKQKSVAIENVELHEDLKRKERLEKYLSHQVVDSVLSSAGPIELGGVRKNVTILFSDIRDFTSMSEKMEPEEIVRTLNEYFSTMTNIVIKYNGLLDKYMGDSIMAVFGAPVERYDDAQRAVKTAVEMQQALARLCSKWRKEERPTFDVGIGVATGDVVAGNLGSEHKMEYTVVGSVVNLTSRLCSVARGGQILINQRTYELVQYIAEASPLPPITVKGVSRPVQVYEVVRLR
ncbi:MAG: adenylate/guanylate cyclase domain-containing protein [bacterium]